MEARSPKLCPALEHQHACCRRKRIAIQSEPGVNSSHCLAPAFCIIQITLALMHSHPLHFLTGTARTLSRSARTTGPTAACKCARRGEVGCSLVWGWDHGTVSRRGYCPVWPCPTVLMYRNLCQPAETFFSLAGNFGSPSSAASTAPTLASPLGTSMGWQRSLAATVWSGSSAPRVPFARCVLVLLPTLCRDLAPLRMRKEAFSRDVGCSACWPTPAKYRAKCKQRM